MPRPLVGRRVWGWLLGDPQGVEGVGVGRCTSVIREAVTDAYGASTRKGCHADVYPTPSFPTSLPDRRMGPNSFTGISDL